jgi:hypothetical protein
LPTYFKSPLCAIEGGWCPGGKVIAYSDVRTGTKEGLKVPSTLFVRDEVRSPFVAGGGAGFCGIAVSSVVTWHHISFITFREGNIQTIIPEWIGVGMFTGCGSGEGDSNIMPLFQFTGKNGTLDRTANAVFSNK